MYHMYRGFEPRVTKDKELIVKGYATKVIKSDMVILAFNLISVADDPYKAQQDNEQSIQIVMNNLREYGIKDEDVFYTSSGFIPVFDENNEITSYKVTTIFKILFYDLDNLSEFLYNLRTIDTIVEEILFTIKDEQKAWNETLEDAVTNVYDRALAAADRMGVSIENVPQTLREITDVVEVVSEYQKHVLKEFASLTQGFMTMYSIVEATFLIID